MKQNVSFIGFGEAARAFAGAAEWNAASWAFDLKAIVPSSEAEFARAYADDGVHGCSSSAEAIEHAPNVFSLVTADQALSVAKEAAPALDASTIFFDFNSVSPTTKQVAARVVAESGASYADVAIMAPVHPKRLNVPLLVSGPVANRATEILRSVGFQNVKAVGEEIGRASSIKMIRSVMIKGIEALSAECTIAADRAGVLDEVLASLGDEWTERADYNLDRMLIHGTRRAAEMREVVATLTDLGLSASMADATSRWQSEIGSITAGSAPDSLVAKLNLISPQIGKNRSA